MGAEITPQEKQKIIVDSLGEVISIANEVGFELATLECPNAHNCPLVMKSRELIIALKKLFKLMREARQTG